ncbi:MAG: hypothetical protein BWY76_01230 [bacterium ADurb.Bin429]|nr:MAG: hypothetical protein BWY76_01230 [bacterium ADurb.Bin429]
MYGADGTPLLVQLMPGEKNGGSRLSFVAELPPNGTMTYNLRDDGQGKPPASPVTVTKDGKSQILANGLLAMRVPAETEQTFKRPVPAKSLPAPVLNFRIGDGA